MLETSLKKQEKPVVVICDEAHHLHGNTLRSLKRLHELRYGFKRLMGIFLLGQPPLCEKLGRYDLQEVRLRTEWFKLEVFDAVEYLKKRKVIDIFTDDALQHIFNIEGLTPLKMNRLGEAAMKIGYQLGENVITKEVLKHIVV